MSLRHALLGALDVPRTGYDLVKYFDASLGYAWSARHSQIYPELARLKGEGLIEQVAEGPRGSKTYRITREGTEELRRWLRETAPERTVRNDAVVRVFSLWLLEPEERLEFLRGEVAFSRARLAEYEQLKDEDEPRTPKGRALRLALEYGIQTRRAALGWAEWALEQAESDLFQPIGQDTGE
jgi:PadR family transcriptional regulator, regulatory protein AphA